MGCFFHEGKGAEVDYQVEIYDTWGRRLAAFDEVPLLDVVRRAPDEADTIAGMLPETVADLGHAYRICVRIGGAVFCEAYVDRLEPSWGDIQRLILDRYVTFHEVIEVEAQRSARDGNTEVDWPYKNRRIDTIVKHAINSAPGAVHYLVSHGAYPEGAHREYVKFLGRKTTGNELEVGGISQGQWVGANRMDLSGAYAKDGDTISGLVVDGKSWPDLRLLLIDCEETSRNFHAFVRHPETSSWTDDEYEASGYWLRGQAAKTALQSLLDEKGLDFIELNPHQNESGEYDDRVDAYGRYIGLVYGGGECFNASLVELGHADVYLYQGGKYHVPEMELKDFFSYLGETENSVDAADALLTRLDASGGIYELLTMLAYAAGGYVWSVSHDLAVRFRKAEIPDHVFAFDPVQLGVTLRSRSSELANALYFSGNPLVGTLNETYTRSASIDAFGFSARQLEYFGLTHEADSALLAEGLLDDLAYPEPCGEIEFFQGNSNVRVGDIVEVRGLPLRRLDRAVEGEWGGRFEGRLIGRVREIRHRFSGGRVSTRVRLTSPLRSVSDPLSFMVRSQPGEHILYQFRLDDAEVGVDMGFHLD